MWAHFVNAAIGVWLMAAPAVLGYGVPAETSDRIVGPLIATFAVVAWWEATRGARWANLPLGLWLIASPWILGYDSLSITLHSMMAGAVVAGLSTIRGTVNQRFGGGWRALVSKETRREYQSE